MAFVSRSYPMDVGVISLTQSATGDPVNTNVNGWKFPRVKGNKFTIDLDALVEISGANAGPTAFDLLVSTWQAVEAYSIIGGGLTISGNGSLSSGKFGHTTDE